MKRVGESGASYRNKKAKEENIRKNKGALLKLVRVSSETQNLCQGPQALNLAEKYAFLSPTAIFDVNDKECNLDQAPQDIDREKVKLECVRLRAFVAATNCQKELIDCGHLDLFKFIFESKLKGG
ncbi:hypothetical protein NPIL_494901 [Nephila pilipes]|uniref:Uncharacterized protein n=1 Tax=Nephila pilipes TaxID=299642 RepID=A0A8X6QWM7_NEPPI|nr:hypothetical protein NPIL_494901 [Nephila pilipes]